LGEEEAAEKKNMTIFGVGEEEEAEEKNL